MARTILVADDNRGFTDLLRASRKKLAAPPREDFEYPGVLDLGAP
jgi:hypothetical protein